MYAPQTAIDPSLTALLQTAQMVTPDQTPTVAAQVAQAAQQKMRPQGIMQGMQGAKQDYAAAQPSMMRNMQQQQVQQMMQEAMRPKPAGIEGIPANNMQGMQRMAGGGVVGYASRGYVDPQFPEVYETSEADLNIEQMREAARRKQEEDERRRKLEFLESTGAPQAAQYREPVPVRPSVPVAPIPEGSDRRQDIPEGGIVSPGMSKAIPAPRPVARPPAAPAAPQGGIAQLAARPTYDVASVAAAGAPYITAGEGDIGKLRAAEGRRAEFEKTLPDLSAKGIEALRQRMADVEGAEAQRKKDLPIDQSIAWLLGGKEGVGGSALAAQRFKAAQNAAADAFSQARLGNQQAQLLMEKAQQERQLGRFDRAIALEREATGLMEKARDNALKAQELAQRGAGAQFQGAVQMYEGEQNRDANRKLEEYRRQTQLMRPKDQDNVARLESMKLAELTDGKPENATPSQKLQALDFAIKTSRGTGVEEKTELSNLRLRATMIQNELKEMLGESPRKQQLQRDLDTIYKQLSGASAAAPAQLPSAALSQLKAGVVTTFANGQQWTLENGQPKQVK